MISGQAEVERKLTDLKIGDILMVTYKADKVTVDSIIVMSGQNSNRCQQPGESLLTYTFHGGPATPGSSPVFRPIDEVERKTACRVQRQAPIGGVYATPSTSRAKLCTLSKRRG